MVASHTIVNEQLETVTSTYAQALNAALSQEMRRDARVTLIGEDIGIGGVYTVTQGLHDEFGEHRVIDTPISEAGFVGIAAGAAVAGLRPVVELMFADFALVAADQLLNQIPKLQLLSAGRYDLPITIRTQQGISGGGGPQHSQSLESLFAHVPGFAVALPYSAADAKGLLTSAIRMNEPTIVIEHKALYFRRGEVPVGDYAVPFGQAAVLRHGTDVTLVAYSQAVGWCLQAAEFLAERYGISAEVIDLRTIVPLDIESVVTSVRSTNAVVVVQEAGGMASIASEIIAQLHEKCWSDLLTPARRVCGLDIPVPYSRPLERYWLPSVQDVVDAAREAVESK
ncbi:alpha-ketoacid dehydrogenase subunit beta [Dactylosporangium sp. NPDC051484]|uniref:alpha-ketoacid dehydrogenase subunit beta n=1 Tax=Dactylosporangium sp. NPDC051484 TaxID=3154942 RepID=UPI00344C835C